MFGVCVCVMVKEYFSEGQGLVLVSFRLYLRPGHTCTVIL
jgi:hypothetical protein